MERRWRFSLWRAPADCPTFPRWFLMDACKHFIWRYLTGSCFFTWKSYPEDILLCPRLSGIPADCLKGLPGWLLGVYKPRDLMTLLFVWWRYVFLSWAPPTVNAQFDNVLPPVSLSGTQYLFWNLSFTGYLINHSFKSKRTVFIDYSPAESLLSDLQEKGAR